METALDACAVLDQALRGALQAAAAPQALLLLRLPTGRKSKRHESCFIAHHHHRRVNTANVATRARLH